MTGKASQFLRVLCGVLPRLVITVLLAATLAFPATAQAIPGLTTSTSSSKEADAADQSSQSDETQSADEAMQDLIEVLKDDTARQKFLDALEQSQSSDETGDQASADSETATTEDSTEAALANGAAVRNAVATFFSDLLSGAQTNIERIGNQLSMLPGRLSALFDSGPSFVFEMAFTLALPLILTYAILGILHFVGRRAQGLVMRLLGNGNVLLRLVVVVCIMLVNAAFVLLAFLLASIVLGLISGVEALQTKTFEHYVSAFFSVEFFMVLVSGLLLPRTPSARLLPLADRPAKIIEHYLRGYAIWLGYGLLLVVPLFGEGVSMAAGRAAWLLVLMPAILFGVYMVTRYRVPVCQTLAGPAEGPARSRIRQILGNLWYVPAYLYLLLALITVTTRTTYTANRFLDASTEVGIAVILGLLIVGILNRAVASGIKLPKFMQNLPALEKRFTKGMPQFLSWLSFLIVIGVLLYALERFNLIQVSALLGSEFGLRMIDAIWGIASVLIIAFLLWSIIEAWIDHRLNPNNRVTPTAREKTLLALFRNAALIVIVAFSLMFTLSAIGINIAPLLASAGVVGLAIGFGAQKLVQDVITGVFIQLEGAIDVGDVVNVGGVSGVVERLTVRSVALRDLEGVYHIVPFSSVDTVSNYMRGFSYYLADMGVAYREDVEETRTAMFDAFEELKQNEEIAPNILGDLEWMGLDSFGDSAIVVRARIKTLPGKQWETGRAYNAVLKRIFDNRNIEIPFPHTTIYFGEDKKGNAPPMHVVDEPRRRQSQKSAEPKKAAPEKPSSTSLPGKEPPPDDDDG